MPYNQLLLSLIGGYLFVTRFNKTKYSINRSDGQRLLLESALWGSLLLLLALFLKNHILLNLPFLRTWWLSLIPLKGLGAPALSLVLGYTLPWLFNIPFDDAEQNEISYKRYSDYVGLVCFRAMRSNKQICITLKNGKVYVGFVKSCNTAGRKDEQCSVFIQPSKSGYRKETTHELVFNTFYTDVINKTLERAKKSKEHLDKIKSGCRGTASSKAKARLVTRLIKEAEIELGKFDMAIPLKDVVSIVIFEDDIYDRFNPAIDA